MSTPTLADDAGRPVRLGDRIAAGGEGAVYAVPADAATVAKVYHRPPPPHTVEKLAAMAGLAGPGLLGIAAWPTRVLYDPRSRAAAGFLMPRMDGFQPMQGLYNPVQRIKWFPRAGWDFQLRAAANLAAAFDEVHKAGCLIADVNQSNAFVSAAALVRLIDCDSFQVRAGGRQFLCDVGTPLYVPPELVGKPLRGLARTENHDRFGLAVLVYQLLFVGRHPYAGVYSGREEPEPDFLIANYKFAQGPLAHTWGMAPPPFTPTLADLPAAVGDLFRRAFERGGEAGTRPRPTDWIAALGRLEAELATCPADAGHKFWKGAGGCVWCRIARGGGPEYYYGVADGGGRFAVDEARLADVLRRLAAVPADPFPYDRMAFATTVPPAPRALSGRLAELRAAVQAADAVRQVALDRRQADEHQERRQAGERERQAVADITVAFRRRDTALAAEADAAAATVRALSARGRRATNVLLAALATGLVLVCLGFAHALFAAAGGLVLCVAGVLTIDHLTRSPAAQAQRRLAAVRRQREGLRERADERTRAARRFAGQAVEAAANATREALQPHDAAVAAAGRLYRAQLAAETAARRRALADAEASLAAVELTWAAEADDHRRRHRDAAREVGRLAAACRGLSAEYQAELDRLTAGAEQAARLRHLRLHLLADADIPKVGAGRKQALAAAGVFTAADITAAAVRSVKGFGDALTTGVLAWQAEVAGRFRFDPRAALPPAALREPTARCQARQQQMLAEAGRLVAELEAGLAAGRAAVQALARPARAALADAERARADLAVVPT